MIGFVALGLGVAALAAGAAEAGRLHWRLATQRAIDRLVDLQPPTRTDVRNGEVCPRLELRGLPAPVVRYFEFALAPRQPRIRVARMHQKGTFATKRDAWSPFDATEVFTVTPPGFVWDARIRMSPLMSVRVRDSLVDGVGAMHGEVAGLVPIVDQHGTREIAAGTLLRYLAEAPWLPTALLPAAGVEWTPIDDETACASLEHAGVQVSMEVHFGPRGEIARITADRYREVDGRSVLTPWEGRFSDYIVVDGMRVPSRAEVGWHLDDGWFPYWRGVVDRVVYETTTAA